MNRLLRHVPQEHDGAVRFDEIMEEFKAKFDDASPWSINDWISTLAKRGGPKKRFQYCLNPNSSKHLLYFRAIQGHSGVTLVDPALEDNVLLLDDFTEYIYHIGNVTRSGLIPGGRSLKMEGNPGFTQPKYGRNSIRLGQAKNRTIHKYLETPQNNVLLVQFKARSEDRIAVLSSTITRSRSLQHTACDVY